MRERYGLAWVCLGEPAGDIAPPPEHEDPNLRKVTCRPYEVMSSGPRIIENFLDMAHFAFVHCGTLGDLAHTKAPDCAVAPFEDPADDGRHTGVIA